MIPVNEPLIAKNALAYASDCIKSGWISSAGAYIRKFEEAFADYLGVKRAVTTTSGTTPRVRLYQERPIPPKSLRPRPRRK